MARTKEDLFTAEPPDLPKNGNGHLSTTQEVKRYVTFPAE